MKQNEYEKALEAFRHVLVLDPGFANAYLNLGIIFSDVYRDGTKALFYFKQYVELDGPRKDEVRAWMAELKP
jgi:lipoprotein NlpI